jgi:fermentation-respiration switch protein FrsA (DUF1100 family)
MKAFSLILFASGLFLLAACSGAGRATATATPVAVAQATPAPTTPAPTATLAPTSTPPPTATPTATSTATPTATATPTLTPTPTPISTLSVEWGRKQTYPGSEIVIEQKLDPGRNYSRYIASYKSEGLKIYGLLTVPNGEKPKTGWPIIIFNHGYIPPTQYRTTERYVAYQDAFAAAGYITFKSDYRGHGSSEGRASGGFGNIDYTADVLNALASVKRMPEADPKRIGMWGHSMGGGVTLRAMVLTKDVKAGVIWAGTVASITDQLLRGRSLTGGGPTPTVTAAAGAQPAGGATATATPTGGSRRSYNELIAQYGAPDQNPAFWDSLSPNSYLKDLGGPIQLQHGTADTSVPHAYSVRLDQQLKAAGQTDEFFSYPGDDHNLSQNLTVALQRSVTFFDKYVKTAAP